ncbi:hypothetical protein D9M71_571780 [compost metagenome]
MANTRVASCQGHSKVLALLLSPTGVSALSAGLSCTFNVRAGRLLCSRWSSRVFHQATSSAGRASVPLWVGTKASRSSRLAVMPRSLISLRSSGWSG